jgi:hypothetical protein
VRSPAAARTTRALSVETAAELLDFSSKAMTDAAAREQLRGAVAIHNILQAAGVAYLADEVGMGKTYVALGALALLRHFEPGLRALVIAPRENIQKKWIKEVGNFTARNVRFSDLRMRSLQGTPARGCVSCASLVELLRETSVDPDRDFFARLTSFSLPIGKDAETLKPKRDALLGLLPWLKTDSFTLHDRETFKDNFARALNAALPPFDLVIVDEAHNLKHGFRSAKSTSSRNRVLGIAFGHKGDGVRDIDVGAGGRLARRVLFLSATPVEDDYAQLWNQLDLFGVAGSFSALKDPKASDEDKRECARRFLVRRVTKLVVNGEAKTKNQYRLEWRGGGVHEHDHPLGVPKVKEQLVVALVQKKVSEVLASTRFNNSFQVGMLASFESFLQTAKVKAAGSSDETESSFDDAEQTDDHDERLGIDVGAVDSLAADYRRTFRAELPHPKMDALVERLSRSFDTGEKALVFVRRVASVTELKRKLDERFNDHLIGRLRKELKPALRDGLDRLVTLFGEERQALLRRRGIVEDHAPTEEDGIDDELPPDKGDTNSFFGWFFRGDGPPKVLSGAALGKRLAKSIFFEDNHVAWLLGVSPGRVTEALVGYLGWSRPRLTGELEQRARLHLKEAKKQRREDLFAAFQHAAIELLAAHPGRLRDRAKVVRDTRFVLNDRTAEKHPSAVELKGALEERTFFTALRADPELRVAIWPEPRGVEFPEQFHEQELRREMISAMSRLGHPFIDLYVLAVNRIGSFKLGSRDDETGARVDEYVALLKTRSETDTGAFRELRLAAENFDLILNVNAPSLRTQPLPWAARQLGRLLGKQQPIGGMSGQVNSTLVSQFRMPGYPYVLVTTDLLQEGEDLHTFCSNVYHYGISWMPSSMEQRVGRIDRVGSHTDRRLSAKRAVLNDATKLQVLYPHLSRSVEALQVERVLERMHRFMELMHQDLCVDLPQENKLNVATEIVRPRRVIPRITNALETAFPGDQHVNGRTRPLAVQKSIEKQLLKRFELLRKLGRGRLVFEESVARGVLFGTIQLQTRTQPFTLFARSIAGRPLVRCVSPVGQIEDPESHEIVRTAVDATGVRLTVFEDDRFKSYNVTIEGDVVLGPATADLERVQWLLDRVTLVADRLEKEILELDQSMDVFRDAIKHEPAYER